ncbi:rhodopsin, GQ-coupled-like isoform X2 [Ptychodera flava]
MATTENVPTTEETIVTSVATEEMTTVTMEAITMEATSLAMATTHEVTTEFTTMGDVTTQIMNVTNMTDWLNVTNSSEPITPAYMPQLASKEAHYLIAVILSVMGFIGFFGNGLVIYVFTKTKYLRTPGNMLIVNLAISDWLMSITNFPPMIASSFNQYWLFGKLGCELYGFAGGLSGLMSIYTMTAIAYDRYYVICKPMKATRTVTSKRSMKFIAGVWFYALLWSALPFAGVGAYILEGYATSCTFDYIDQSLINVAFVTAMYTAGFLVPVFWIISCYSRMVYTMRKHRQELDRIQDKAGRQGDVTKTQEAVLKVSKEAKSEFKLAKIALILIVCFMFSWVPYAAMAAVGLILGHGYLTPTARTLPVLFAKTYCIYNPIVYALTHVKFQKAIREQVPWLSCLFSSSKGPDSSKSIMSVSQMRQGSVSSHASDATEVSDVEGHTNRTFDVELKSEANKKTETTSL